MIGSLRMMQMDKFSHGKTFPYIPQSLLTAEVNYMLNYAWKVFQTVMVFFIQEQCVVKINFQETQKQSKNTKT